MIAIFPEMILISLTYFKYCNINFQAEFDAGLVDLAEFENEVHIVSGALCQN